MNHAHCPGTRPHSPPGLEQGGRPSAMEEAHDPSVSLSLVGWGPHGGSWSREQICCRDERNSVRAAVLKGKALGLLPDWVHVPLDHY